MKREGLGLLIAACIGWLLAGFLLGLRLWPRGDPAAPEVTLNPTPAEAKPADRVIKIDLYGQGSGQGQKIPPGRTSTGGDSKRAEPGTSTHTGEPVQPITGQSEASEPEGPPGTPEPGLMVGDQVAGTWSGEAEATVTDARTGRLLDTGTVSLEGTFMATVPAPGELNLKLDFDAPLTMAYTRPRPLFSLRAGVELDAGGGLAADVAIGRRFFIDGLTAWAWARRDRAGDVLLGVRLEYQVDVPPF